MVGGEGCKYGHPYLHKILALNYWECKLVYIKSGIEWGRTISCSNTHTVNPCFTSAVVW